MNTYDALIATVCESEGDSRWDAMSVLADWLEENGDATAKGWRILAKDRKWPAIFSELYIPCTWWVSPELLYEQNAEPTNVIPYPYWKLLKGSYFKGSVLSGFDYKTMQEALTDAARVLSESP